MSAVITAQALGATMSFSQQLAQRSKQRQAEADAEAAMVLARRKLDVNFAEQATIKKEAYDSEREALLVQGAQAINAGIESERGAAATAGRVYAGQQKAQAAVRAAQADEMTNIESAIIEEYSRLRDLNVSLDLEEVAGNQMKAANAQAAAAAAGQQGWQNVVGAAGDIAAAQKLYKQDFKAQQAALRDSQSQYSQVAGVELPASFGGGMSPRITPELMTEINQQAGLSELNKNAMGEKLLGEVLQMKPYQFKQWQKGLSPQDYQRYFGNAKYAEAYNAFAQN